MSFSVQMPALGTITRWLKQIGDHVEVDEPLLEVSTDKVDTEIPSPAAGVLEQVLAGEDDTVEVGGELAVVGDGSGGGADASGAAQSQAQAPAESQSQAEPGPAGPAGLAGSAGEPAPAAAEPGSAGSGAAGSGSDVVMPALGESVSEGTITRWLKQVGDHVEVDEALLEVSTDKVDTEIPSPAAGTVVQVLADEGDTVEVGVRLAVVGEAAAAAPSQPAAGQQAQQQAPQPQAQQAPVQDAEPAQPAQSAQPSQPAAPAQPAQPAQPQPAPSQSARPQSGSGSGSGSGPYVTPLVRKLAGEHGVDLASVTGTGVGGRIRKQDVQAAIDAQQQAPAQQAPAQPSAQPAAQPSGRSAAGAGAVPSEQAQALRGTTQKMSRLRQALARRMVESLQTSAQLTTVVEVDVTRIARLRGGRSRRSRPPRASSSRSYRSSPRPRSRRSSCTPWLRSR